MRQFGTTVFTFSAQRRRLNDLPHWKRFLFFALVTPLLLAGGASGAYYLNLHRVCSAMTLEGMRPAAAFQHKAQRILVLAPHCDDETLGAGGLIADARKNGIPVRVAFLTNGDGFRVAASRTLKDVNISPSDFVRFAELRQKESLAALEALGVSEKEVTFLGYPDRGIKPMWEEHWKRDNLYRSAYTGHTKAPYSRAYTPHAPYCGDQLQRDLVRLFREYHPTDIYVTHPADDHPDHHAAAAFAQFALRVYQTETQAAAAAGKAVSAVVAPPPPRLHYYIVHRGDWPLPQGSHPDVPLLPPPGMTGLDTRWGIYRVSAAGKEAKMRALSCYVSQMNITRRFLTSFVRTNELFGSLPEPDCKSADDPNSLTYPPVAALDARGDNVARYADPAADLTGVIVQRENNVLRVELRTRGPVSPLVRYRVLLRDAAAFRDSNGGLLPGTKFVTLDLQAPRRSGVLPSTIEATVPLQDLGGDSAVSEAVWVSAETRWAGGLPVDRAGYRFFPLTNAAGNACHENPVPVTRSDTYN